MIRFSATLACCALASGCVSVPPMYSETWPRQMTVEAGTCPEIDGEYQDAGEATLKVKRDTWASQMMSLSHLMNGGWSRATHGDKNRLGRTYYHPGRDKYLAVRLRREEDELHVEAVDTDGGTRAFVLPTQRPCRDSLLPMETTMHADPFSGAAAHGSYSLGRAEDGSLLVYVNVVDTFLLALWGRTSIWVRFPPTTPGLPPESPGVSTS